MKTIVNKKGIETIIFSQTLEQEAIDQIEELANFAPYQNQKIRVMPDAHVGKGCTIGTTMTITDKVTPNLVGLDIGCGMLTIKLNNKNINFTQLDQIIKEHIPSGFQVHQKKQRDFDFTQLRAKKNIDTDRALLSIGTLGGGNHFIEVGENKTGDLFLVIHSGSRKLGTDICNYYQIKAIEQAKNRHVELVTQQLQLETNKKKIATEMKKAKRKIPQRDLAYLSGDDFDNYMNDMFIVQKFASLNRHTMADILLEKANLEEIERFETIHNYIDFDRMILRKGAVSAEAGEKLLIPINMRDGSLLCIGKGNPDWNYSAPHGAGRLMSRSEAKRQLNIDDFKKTMQGVFTTSVVKSTLDEAPSAYKPMQEIINAITETADLIDVIKPIYNYKAH